MKTIVFYHMMSAKTPCPDGIASAWAARTVLGNKAEYIGCCYGSKGETPPQLDIPQSGDRVYILDFSFEANVLETWKERGVKITLIDHHKDKMEALLGYAPLEDLIVFDNSKCGAVLTWEYFYEDVPVPAFLWYIDDRDRWQHQLPYTKEIHAAVGKLGRTFQVFDVLSTLTQDELIWLLGDLGKKEIEQRDKQIAKLAEQYQWIELAGHSIPTVHLAPNDAWATSEVCQKLYLQFPDAPFTACYYEESDSVKWGLRSNPKGNNFDVAAIARQFGGDGHRNAAGFSISGLPTTNGQSQSEAFLGTERSRQAMFQIPE
ncbi:MAG TPA: DHHA1 domain-containing protein [Cyanophyceae cyanobacterium]